MSILATPSAMPFLLAFEVSHYELTTPESYRKGDDESCHALIGRTRLGKHVSTCGDDLESVAYSRDVVSTRKRREECIPHGLEYGMIGDFKRCSERKVRGVVQRFAVGEFAFRKLVRTASCDENVQRRRSIVININWEVEGMGYATLKDRGYRCQYWSQE